MPGKPLTLQQAADKLGVHYMTVYRYVRTGKLPATRVGGAWQIDPADLVQMKRAVPRSSRNQAARATATKSQLEARLLAGDEPGAWAVLEAALASDRTPSEVLLQLVAPALESIGDRWSLGELTVADEHLASAVAVRLISRIGARFGRRGPKRGSVVLTTPPAERHSAPVAIAADLLRWAGFNVIELGADTPADALAQALIGVPDLLAVAMACTTPESTTSACRVIAHLRTALPDTTVLLGGAAIADADQALRLGADGFTGRRGDDLVRAVEELAAAS
jgi:excisionase family DNA binding protein